MTRIFVCLFVLFILSITIRFGDCEIKNPECDDENNIKPGSDKTNLSKLEKFLKKIVPVKWLAEVTKSDKESVSLSFSDVLEKIREKFPKLIHPGTLWCGDGDRAHNETDLGRFKKTDACCKAHDNCKNNIAANNTEVNLINNGIFTKSACTCDTQFYDCLKNASNIIASEIGVTYFNVLGPQCFKCKCPEKGCDLKDGTECKDYCKKYEWVNNRRF